MLKAGGAAIIPWLTSLLYPTWNPGIILIDWRRGVVVLIWEEKCEAQDSHNYEEVTFLSVPSKVLPQILLNRLGSVKCCCAHQCHEQSCFVPKKSTIDRIFELTERLCDFRTALLAAYVDPRMTFYSMNRDGLWQFSGSSLNTLEARQSDIRLVFWYRLLRNVVASPWFTLR